VLTRRSYENSDETITGDKKDVVRQYLKRRVAEKGRNKKKKDKTRQKKAENLNPFAGFIRFVSNLKLTLTQ